MNFLEGSIYAFGFMSAIKPLKNEAQTALFKDPVRTVL